MLHGWLANPLFIDDVLKPSFTLGTLPPTSMLDCLKFNRIFGRLHPKTFRPVLLEAKAGYHLPNVLRFEEKINSDEVREYFETLGLDVTLMVSEGILFSSCVLSV